MSSRRVAAGLAAALFSIALIPASPAQAKTGALAWLAATAIGLGVLVVTAWRRGHEDGVAAPPRPAPVATAAG